MYEIEIYQTLSGNKPFEKYIGKMLKQHKHDEFIEISNYLHKLEEFGLDINYKFKANAYKYLRDGIYELRPSSSRIFFFFINEGKFIILHGYEKKQNKTNPDEIKMAIKEKNDFLKRC